MEQAPLGPDFAFPPSSPATGDGRRLGLDRCRRGSCNSATGGVCASSRRGLVRPGYQVPLLKKSKPRLWPRLSVLTQRTAARTAVRQSRADSRPSPRPPARLVIMGIRWGRGPAVRPVWPTSCRSPITGAPPRKTLLLQSRHHDSRMAWDDGPMGGGGGGYGPWGGAENMEKTGNSTGTTTDSWQRPGRLPCGLASSGWPLGTVGLVSLG